MTKDTRRRDVGSWRERRPGVWEVRVSCGYKADGTRRTIYKTVNGTEADARKVAHGLASDLGRHANIHRGITLAATWEAYLADKGQRLAAKTVQLYTWLMDRTWLPAFGDRDISTLSRQDVQDTMLAESSRDMARRLRTVLSSVLSWAVSAGVLDENVARGEGFELPGDTGSEWEDESLWDDDPFAAIEGGRDVWDAQTVMRALPLMRGLPLEPAWLAMVGAGLRIEEALALRKMDVRRIEVNGREVTQVAVHHARTDLEERKRSKTRRSVRIAAVMEPFGERLWEIASGLPTPKSEVCPVSASNQNKRWRSYFGEERTHRRMAESRKVSGRLRELPYIPLSRMRATHATLMQEAGVLDSVNAAAHGHSTEVSYTNYKRADTVGAAIQTEEFLSRLGDAGQPTTTHISQESAG